MPLSDHACGDWARRDERRSPLPVPQDPGQISPMAAPRLDLQSLRALSVAERLQLVEDLWDSIAAEAPGDAFPVSDQLASELDRRRLEAETDPTASLSWHAVRDTIAAGTFRPET